MLVAPLVSTLLNTEDSPGYDERLGKPVRPSIQYLGEPARTLICPMNSYDITLEENTAGKIDIVLCKVPALAILTGLEDAFHLQKSPDIENTLNNLIIYALDVDNNFVELVRLPLNDDVNTLWLGARPIFEILKNKLYRYFEGNPQEEKVQLFNKYGTNPDFFIGLELGWQPPQSPQIDKLWYALKLNYIEGTPSTIGTENKLGDR